MNLPFESSILGYMKRYHIQRKVKSFLPYVLLLTIIMLLIIANGCNNNTLVSPGSMVGEFEDEKPLKAKSFYPLDGFEDAREWAVDSADNHAEIIPEDIEITESSGALRVRYWSRGRGKAQIRKEVDYNFSSITHLMIDIYNTSDEPDVTFGFAFRTRNGDRFFETNPVKLSKGWNTGLVVPLNKKMFKETYGADTYRLWQECKGHVTRIMLNFFEFKSPSNQVIVDNLRSNTSKEKIIKNPPPEILSVEQNVEWLSQYDMFEATLRGKATCTDPFDTNDVVAWMHIVTPKGEHLRINGFLYDFEEEDSSKIPVWKVRFTPTETGTYRYEIFLRNREGEVAERDRTFEVFPSDNKGYVRVSNKNARYFEFDSGEFFYPFGQNVCWASDYEYYFRKINNYGGNFVRIWMCPWNLYIEPTKSPGRYDLDVGKELDSILDLARDYGIYIQLVFEYHGMLGPTWDKSPYNVVNGGMCAVPEDFFRHGEAKRFFKKKMEYIINRWGYSPNIMGWELFNEFNLAKFGHENDVYNWHKEMSEYLKEIDPNNHLVTTSPHSWDSIERIWKLPTIDYTQAHFYNPDFEEEIEANLNAKLKFNKPYFVGEFGRGWRASDDIIDKEGGYLHHVLWANFMTESSGGAMPWWWDTYIEPFNLYRMFDSLARFGKGLDRRVENLVPFRLNMQLGKNHIVKIIGLQSRCAVYLWFYNPDLVEHPNMPREGNLLTKDITVYFKNMLDGKYTTEFWDAYQGHIFKKAELTAKGGEFSVQLHKSDWDYALKIKRENTSPPEAGAVINEDKEEE